MLYAIYVRDATSTGDVGKLHSIAMSESAAKLFCATQEKANPWWGWEVWPIKVLDKADEEIMDALRFYAERSNWLTESDEGGYVNRIEWNASGDLWRAPWKMAEQALARAV